MSAATLLAQGRQMLQEQFPATVQIKGTTYQCATTGLRRGMVEADGGAELTRTVSFWIAAAAFATAGQTIPRERTSLLWNGAEYLIDNVTLDPAGVTVLLACMAQPQ